MLQLNYEEQLQQLFTNVNEWLKFAEAKNFGLLTLNAAIVFGFTQIEFKQDSVIENAGYFVFMPFALLSFLTATISLMPIMTKIESGHTLSKRVGTISNWISKENFFENIHYYGYLKTLSQQVFEQKFLVKTASTDAFSDFEKELAIQILYNSRICSLKYQFFKIGTTFFLLGIICALFFGFVKWIVSFN